MKYLHTNLIARNWKELAQFYINVFECKAVPPERDLSAEWLGEGVGIPGAKLKGIHLRLPGYGNSGPTLEIFQYKSIIDQSGILPNQRGFGHVAFKVENISDTINEILENGGTKLGSLVDVNIEGRPPFQFIYMRDPEGNIIELQS